MKWEIMPRGYLIPHAPMDTNQPASNPVSSFVWKRRHPFVPQRWCTPQQPQASHQPIAASQSRLWLSFGSSDCPS